MQEEARFWASLLTKVKAPEKIQQMKAVMASE